jgi:hypothetical protein
VYVASALRDRGVGPVRASGRNRDRARGRARAREREGGKEGGWCGVVWCVYVCVCERERLRPRDWGLVRDRERAQHQGDWGP